MSFNKINFDEFDMMWYLYDITTVRKLALLNISLNKNNAQVSLSAVKIVWTDT